MRYLLPLLLLACALPMASCSDDGGGDAGSDTGDLADGGDLSDQGEGDIANDAESDTSAEAGDTFETAAAITLGDPLGVNGVIAPPGDVDMYRFQAEAGDWIGVIITANRAGSAEKLNSVITLFSGPTAQLAQNDDAYPTFSAGPDSEILYLARQTGTYYLRVEDWTTWAEETPSGGPEATYHVAVLDAEQWPYTTTVEVESGVPIDVTLADRGAAIAGTFEDNDDVDVYAFTLDAAGPLWLNLMRAGDEGYGSTTTAGRFWLVDSNDESTIAVSEHRRGRYAMYPELAAGDYKLHIAHPGWEERANDFYVVKLIPSSYAKTSEQDDDGNDQHAGAESYVLETDPEYVPEYLRGNLRVGLMTTWLDGDDDVDYFSFETTEDRDVSTNCASQFIGSGVIGLRLGLRNATDVEVASASESPDEPARPASIPSTMLAPGTYYLRVSKTGQLPTVTGTFVRCNLFLFPVSD